MPITDAVLYLHGTGTSAYGPLTVNAGVYGDTLCYAGSQESNIELDFGAPNTGTTFPYVPAFPSYTEKAYTFPPEILGTSTISYGVHIIVGSAFNTLTSISFNVQSGAATGATTVIASRVLTLAQLGIAGAHYYIPLSGNSIQEFLRFNAVLTGSDPTTGTIISWFGPQTGGEQ